jgi:L,D-peptidoglycan transpeptidase YkuD (ErfK/YbiS/YcfS/YnhG family)
MSNLVPFIDVYAPGTLLFQGHRMVCALGPGGIAASKKEGDGVTPAGTFPLRRVFYRPDRTDPPQTGLTVQALQPADGWCDDPTKAEYNRFVILPFSGSFETLWREDNLYDIIIEVGYNDDPPIANSGSAIFMHVARENYQPTHGCVALTMADLLTMLRSCHGETHLRINLP